MTYIYFKTPLINICFVFFQYNHFSKMPVNENDNEVMKSSVFAKRHMYAENQNFVCFYQYSSPDTFILKTIAEVCVK